MKKFFYKLAIVALVSAICAVVLFFIFDYRSIRGKYGTFREAISKNKNVFVMKPFVDFPINYGDLGDEVFWNFKNREIISKDEEFDDIDLKFKNVRVKVEKSEDYGIIFASDQNIDLGETVDIDKEGGAFNIKQGDNDYRCGVIIKTPDPQNLNIRLSSTNGDLLRNTL